MEHDLDCDCEKCMGYFFPVKWRKEHLARYALFTSWKLAKAVTDGIEEALNDVLRHITWSEEQDKKVAGFNETLSQIQSLPTYEGDK